MAAQDLTIDQVALTRLEDGSEAVHKPLVVDWFPAFTMLGHQPAVMMGCTTGAIVKYNTHAGRHPGYLMYSRARQEAYVVRCGVVCVSDAGSLTHASRTHVPAPL